MERYRNAVALVGVACMLMLLGACMMPSKPDASGYELDVINATLFLPEFETRRKLSDLTIVEMHNILGEKNVV